ncbi:hypothetical protein NC653_036574 [Populus alba x Populus x berolinensis]|uniref:RNase H type-1 domain-containing protein n=1 Tax=Populus alba x Populus x berolinensis TaxID=444605 RepID=A0AAD6PVX8_9ROSI|nr:hypothetical protein NC653_036574 [Populus alba x Populus x berolinensis]
MVAGILATEFGYLLVLACNEVVIDGALINMPEQFQQVKQLIRGFSLAFSPPTGSVSSRAAEGIELAVSLGCQKLVESDSMEAIILLLTSDIADHHPQDALIKDTRVFLSRIPAFFQVHA